MLKEEFGAQIVGPKADRDRIPGIDVALAEGDSWDFAGLEMRVLDTPGHTRGHITLFFPGPEAVFTGDPLHPPSHRGVGLMGILVKPRFFRMRGF